MLTTLAALFHPWISLQHTVIVNLIQLRMHTHTHTHTHAHTQRETPISVPYHWKQEIKESLDPDVQKGSIEPVP